MADGVPTREMFGSVQPAPAPAPASAPGPGPSGGTNPGAGPLPLPTAAPSAAEAPAKVAVGILGDANKYIPPNKNASPPPFGPYAPPRPTPDRAAAAAALLAPQLQKRACWDDEPSDGQRRPVQPPSAAPPRPPYLPPGMYPPHHHHHHHQHQQQHQHHLPFETHQQRMDRENAQLQQGHQPQPARYQPPNLQPPPGHRPPPTATEPPYGTHAPATPHPAPAGNADALRYHPPGHPAHQPAEPRAPPPAPYPPTVGAPPPHHPGHGQHQYPGYPAPYQPPPGPRQAQWPPPPPGTSYPPPPPHYADRPLQPLASGGLRPGEGPPPRQAYAYSGPPAAQRPGPDGQAYPAAYPPPPGHRPPVLEGPGDGRRPSHGMDGSPSTPLGIPPAPVPPAPHVGYSAHPGGRIHPAGYYPPPPQEGAYPYPPGPPDHRPPPPHGYPAPHEAYPAHPYDPQGYPGRSYPSPPPYSYGPQQPPQYPAPHEYGSPYPYDYYPPSGAPDGFPPYAPGPAEYPYPSEPGLAPARPPGPPGPLPAPHPGAAYDHYAAHPHPHPHHHHHQHPHHHHYYGHPPQQPLEMGYASASPPHYGPAPEPPPTGPPPHTIRHAVGRGAAPDAPTTAAAQPSQPDASDLRQQLQQRLEAELQEQRTLRSQLRDMQEHRASAAGYSADGFAGYDPYDRFSPDPDDDLGLLLPNSYFDAYPGLFPPSPTEGQGPAEGGTEAASKSAATPRCMYFDQGRCKHGDGCRFYHPGRFLAALTDLTLDRVAEYTQQVLQCAQRLVDGEGLVLLKDMRDLFLEDINEVRYMESDTMDDVMAKAVGSAVSYEVPWYRTVPLRPFIQLVLLKRREADSATLLRHCVAGKTVAMIAIHSSQLSMMTTDGTKWVVSPARANAADLGRRVPAWRFGPEVRTLGVDYSLVAPFMSKTYCYRTIRAIADPGPEGCQYRVRFADERPLAAWTCQRSRRLRGLPAAALQAILGCFAPAEEAVLEVAEQARPLQSDVYLHPHI